MENSKYDFSLIEKKWQEKWEKAKIFRAKEGKKKKFYVLDMFPYPSGEGLHMGHAFVFSLGDIFARFKRMQGFNVLYPIGYDSFGLPAENAAIKVKEHPRKYTERAIKNFRKQQNAMGWSYDWDRLVQTSSPDYYKWDQWIFLKMLEKGIAYRKKAPVNWCPKCETVLANEQVINGKCWRHEDTSVEIKHLEQWFFKITDYAEQLLTGLENLNWPENAKKLQRNWIGKSSGTEIDFEVEIPPQFASYLLIEKSFNLDLEKELKRFGRFEIEEIDKDWGKFFRIKVNLDKENDFINFVKDNILTNNPDGGSWYVDSCGTTNKVIFRNKIIDVSSEKGKKEFFDYGKKLGIPEKQLDIKFTREKWPVFTTRPDTIFGVTFVVVSAQHSRLNELVLPERKKEVDVFLKKLKSVSEKEMGETEKEGVFTGSYAINPVTKEKVPIYAGNFVIADYGSGMVMAVPGHDARDFEFARKYNLPIKTVIKPEEYEIPENSEKITEAYSGEGMLINSGEFNDLRNKDAKEEITKYLVKKNIGRKAIQYKLRDWLISRQRYWGTPIPVVYCDKCGIVPVSEKNLPVLLPEKVEFGKGNPLKTNKKFLEISCPKCKSKARRETDTMDTFVNSSWYYLRYTDSKNKFKIFDFKKANYWAPVDHYTGGPEHITAHLIYIRFYTKFLKDLGLLEFDEPALKYFTQGIVHGSDGEKMSKSRGNVIEPLDTIKKYGADTLRLTLISLASPDKSTNWDEKTLGSSFKFLNSVYNFFNYFKPVKNNPRLESKVNQIIKEVTLDVENIRHNLAIIKIRQLFSQIEKNGADKKTAESFLKMFHIYCPFITEELWSKLKNKGFLSIEKWPIFDEKKINPEFEKEDLAREKTIEDVNNVVKIIKEKGKEVSKLYLYVIPNEKNLYEESSNEIEKRTGLKTKIFSVSDKNKYDPENKSSKTKPGKPGIYLE